MKIAEWLQGICKNASEFTFKKKKNLNFSITSFAFFIVAALKCVTQGVRLAPCNHKHPENTRNGSSKYTMSLESVPRFQLKTPQSKEIKIYGLNTLTHLQGRGVKNLTIAGLKLCVENFIPWEFSFLPSKSSSWTPWQTEKQVKMGFINSQYL